MKQISAYDLQHVSFLKQYTVFDLINPKLDDIVTPVLYEIGMDPEKGLQYNVCQHRCLDKKVRVGFTITGELRSDEDFRYSPFCTQEDVAIMAALSNKCFKNDLSLAHELATMAARTPAYQSIMSIDNEPIPSDFLFMLDIDEQERIEQEIEAFGFALEEIRGNQKRKDGSYKAPKHYKEDKEEVRKEQQRSVISMKRGE